MFQFATGSKLGLLSSLDVSSPLDIYYRIPNVFVRVASYYIDAIRSFSHQLSITLSVFTCLDWDTSEVVNIPLLNTVTRFTFACILKHSGLLPAALKTTR